MTVRRRRPPRQQRDQQRPATGNGHFTGFGAGTSVVAYLKLHVRDYIQNTAVSVVVNGTLDGATYYHPVIRKDVGSRYRLMTQWGISGSDAADARGRSGRPRRAGRDGRDLHVRRRQRHHQERRRPRRHRQRGQARRHPAERPQHLDRALPRLRRRGLFAHDAGAGARRAAHREPALPLPDAGQRRAERQRHLVHVHRMRRARRSSSATAPARSTRCAKAPPPSFRSSTARKPASCAFTTPRSTTSRRARSYRYQVGDGAANVSTERSFTTDDGDDNVNIHLFGDTQTLLGHQHLQRQRPASPSCTGRCRRSSRRAT